MRRLSRRTRLLSRTDPARRARRGRRRRRVGSLGVGARGPTPSTSSATRSSPSAYTALETAFQATAAGQDVDFNNSFGPSTTQADDVVAGQPADVVNFSTAPDLQLLVTAGLVSPNWATTGRRQGRARASSPTPYVVLVDPARQPAGHHGMGEPDQGGVQIVTPDPISSGSARWNLLEVYESQIIGKRSRPPQAKTFTNSVVKNIVAEPSSGSQGAHARSSRAPATCSSPTRRTRSRPRRRQAGAASSTPRRTS